MLPIDGGLVEGQQNLRFPTKFFVGVDKNIFAGRFSDLTQ